MRLKVTQVFYYNVDPDWYFHTFPDNNLSLAEKVIKFEKREAEEDSLQWSRLEKGKTIVEIVEE